MPNMVPSGEDAPWRRGDQSKIKQTAKRQNGVTQPCCARRKIIIIEISVFL